MRLVPRLVSLAVLLATTACADGGPISAPGRSNLIGDADARTAGPSGLEQRLVTRLDPAPIGSPYTALLTVTSTLVNTGSAATRVRARTCLVQEADVESTARLDRLEPFVSCSAVSLETDLTPGQSIGPVQVQFGVRSGPGSYTITLRHALSPEFRGEATFRIL